ncbi:exonuclease domain-containing protein [Erythrobacter rubeus]|uniref:Exonuclease domain-containing protein n=1 Tax=Erythrobacter rubeus TaxID=2760803 RepID=A0ABR8KP32_9SPHN|nr:exonuclease domain-containing protein [Erythrobacter rubeus]MBD2842468.1 hypothetical protein [Erythrobacter rubeus]
MFTKWRFDRRLNSLAASGHEVLTDYAGSDWPDRNSAASGAAYLALDFELDGLRRDADLLQAGWVPFAGDCIAMASARSVDIRSDASLDPAAVTIHGIGEQRAARGQKLAEVAGSLIAALSGCIIVAHAAEIEVSALQRVGKAIWGIKLPVRSICTLALERKLHPHLVGAEAYRLGPCRARYGLPDYEVHDALTDAIAAAELFQAQLSRLPEDVILGDLEQR